MIGLPISSVPVSACRAPPAEGGILASTKSRAAITARTKPRPSIRAQTKGKPG